MFCGVLFPKHESFFFKSFGSSCLTIEDTFIIFKAGFTVYI